MLIAPLSQFGRQDLAQAGGKGANLGELVRAGLPVPDGFVITTDAYAAAVERAEVPADRAPVPEPEELRTEIAAAYRELGGGPVAVRSSATAEDLAGAAFAGQHESFLQVIGEAALVDAVAECWASLWTDRAVAYRTQLNLDLREARIAVVVQHMVEAEMAGVMLTADPVSGDRNTVVVDAAPGLGEAVVSGLVTPDHYRLHPDGRVREFRPGRREVVIRGAVGGGTVHESGKDNPPERLPDAVLAELARLAAEVAALFGRPQDIEWAYAGGLVWLLQARPMTALPPPPLRLNAFQRRIGSALLDFVPVRPYPLDMTTWVPDGPIGLMSALVGHFGLRNAYDGLFIEDELGVVDRLVPQTPKPTARLLIMPWLLLRLAHRFDPAHWTDDKRFSDFLARVRVLADRDLETMSWPELLTMPRQALDLINPVKDLRIDYLPGSALALLRLHLALRMLRRSALLGALLITRTRTSDANLALGILADRVRQDPELAAAVAEQNPAALAGFADFAGALASYLEEYGHRETASPVLVSPPTQGESPETVLGLIAVLAGQSSRPRERADPLAELLRHPLLRGRRRRTRMRRLVAAARAGIAFREDSHFYFLKPLPILRRSLLEMGRRLTGTGILNRPDDVFHLRLAELAAISDPAAVADPDSLRETVRARSARRDELAGVRLIDPAAVFPPDENGSDALVTGAPASGGTATGPVRLIREPAEFGRLVEGDVLVCPYTNPAWTPLFQRAAAVMVDAGGPLSHAAIVAREYGIPAVMGTGHGTSILTDGTLVTVDGSRGRVVAAEPAVVAP